MEFLNGKKTYIIAIATALISAYVGLAPTFGWPDVPEWAWGILGAAGLGSMRSAVAKV